MASRYHRPATAADVDYVLDNLRHADFAECMAAAGSIDQRFHDLAAAGLAETILAPDGEPIGLCGVRPTADATGVVWMVGTKRSARFKLTFVREGRRWIEKQLGRFRVLANYVYAGNPLHAAWLAHMGFCIGPAEPRGPIGALFRPFYITRKHLLV